MKIANLFLILVLLFLYVPFSVQSQDSMQERVKNDLENVMVVECPSWVLQNYPTRVVIQIIDNEFHKWNEYDVGLDGEFCIELVEPTKKILPDQKAKELLQSSAEWIDQYKQHFQPSDNTYKYKDDLQKIPPSIHIQPEYHNKLQAPKEEEFRINCLNINSYDKEKEASKQTNKKPPEVQVVIGDDEREKVENTTSYHWNTIGYVQVEFPNGSVVRGTGFLISPYAVLTSAHNFFQSERGSTPQNCPDFLFIPGLDGHTPGPYGHRRAVRFGINTGWVDTENYDFDYGAALIDKPFSGISTFMPLVFEEHQQTIIAMAGYPAVVQNESNSFSMWLSPYYSGEVTRVDDRTIRHNLDSSGGNSGSPIYSAFQRVQVIHSHGVERLWPLSNYNVGTRLVSQNQNIIEGWMNWEPEPVLSVSPNSVEFSSDGGSQSVSITSNISWSVSDNRNWISVNPSSGSGNATVSISAEQNSSTNSRSGSVTISGSGIERTVSVSQSGASPVLSVSPNSVEFSSDGGSQSVSITSNISWSVSDNRNWISVNPSSGSGNATVSISAEQNSSTNSRSGSVTISGSGIERTVSVSQSIDKPKIVELIFPENESEEISVDLEILWQASERAEYYQIRISEDADFSNMVHDSSEIAETSFIPDELQYNTTYFWKVRAGNQSGYSDWSKSRSFTTVELTSAEHEDLPLTYQLHQNYPNPFNPSTQIRFALPEQSHVRLTVYNMLGQQVETLLNETRSSGWHDVTIDASGLPSGAFIYRIEAGDYVETRSMMFVK